ncbi:MAG TPA: hypothetical protein ENK31_02060, partial [Nannocystis exedens]|nr:hypothetical protein [Nannocystis exedens]
IDFLYQRSGYEGLNRLLARLRAGDKMDAALRAAYGFDLNGLWTVWKREMRRRGFKTFPGLVQTSLKFKRPGAEGEEEADYSTISEKQVKDFTHLGELLRARNRMAASLAEYRKAMTAGGDGNPVIQNGAAAALIALERFEEVPDTLERVRSYYPSLVRTHIHLGEAFLHLGRRAEAVTAFEAAVGINPFHPMPHKALAKLYDEAGETKLADRERASLEVLNE